MITGLFLVRSPGRAEKRSAGTSDQTVAAISIEKFKAKVQSPKARELFVDVREESEFREMRIPGTRNIPLSELVFQLQELAGYDRVYLFCLSGPRTHSAARTLAYLGLGNLVSVSGGLKAWKLAGFPVEGS